MSRVQVGGPQPIHPFPAKPAGVTVSLTVRVTRREWVRMTLARVRSRIWNRG